MPKVTLIQVVYNHRRFIPVVFPGMLKQTYRDSEIVAVICGSADGSKEFIAKEFPQVKIIDPGENIGFARAHNLVFAQSHSEFFQLVNPDLVLSSDYVERMLQTFENEKVGAATGKLLHYDFGKNQKTYTIDSTGVEIFKSGRARDRGQHQLDEGQYNNSLKVIAVSAAGAMYRRAALESVKLSKKEGGSEYFDEDFHSYWEDVDLAWRMSLAGWQCQYQPKAVAWHGRGAGSSPGGYKKVFAFIKFHRQLPARVRRLNYQNHILMYLKNSKWLYPEFFAREFFMLLYILLFEPGTLKVLPKTLSLLPKIFIKRRAVQKLAKQMN